MANLILAEIRSGRAAIYIAEINQVRVGMVSAAVHTPSIAEVIENGNMKIGVVTELFVEPDSRRKGVAKKLMRSAELFLKGIGCKILSIHVISANKAAINLYRKQGYSEYEIVLDKRA
ncbi:MAG: GNAT family N-acetyltransferase [Thermoplasmata archaeon YP2-bin.285]|uniref:GNAT family N-acetyltransferase n=1 Tax=Candidatus Sysuiplasma superficiale TaxID=2823368 RepID=A0A8J7YKE6_9ARCH|nr:GNAT family N-acetyltransferase [Candidatus Sysuiplasma superficiale]